MAEEHNPIEAFADGLTESLKSDEAVRREVKFEIMSHLEERMLEQEDATFKDAAEQFGDMELIGKDLVNANQSRLSRRRLARNVIRFGVVPVVLMILLIGIYDGFQRQKVLMGISTMGGGVSMGPGEFDPYVDLTPEQRFYFEGDTSRSTEFERYHAIYERHPDSLMWLNHTITRHLVSEGDYESTDEHLDSLIAFLNKALQQDSNNSRYDILMAHAFFQKGLAEKDTDGEQATYDVVDSAAVQKGLSHFISASRKPHYSTYQPELLAYRSDMLPETTSIGQSIRRIAISASMLLPDVGKNREVFRMLPTAISHSMVNGKAELAKDSLAQWPNLISQINKTSFTLIEVLVTMSLAGEAEKQLIPLVRQHLSQSMAEDQARVLSAVLGIKDSWDDQRKGMDDKTLRAHGGIMANMLMPALGASPTAEELAPSRMVEYSIAEYMAIFWLAFFCLMFTIGLWLLSFIPRICGEGARLSLLPDGRWWLHHLVYAVVCPLILYAILTRGSWFDLRAGALNPTSNMHGFGFELMLYSGYMALSITFGYIAWLRREALVVGVKPLSIPHWPQWVTVLACLGLLAGHVVFPADGASELRLILGALPLTVWGLLMVWTLGVTLFNVKSRSVYGLHVLRGLALQWAIVCVPLVCLAMPYLKHEEAAWIKRDTLMHNPNTVGFTSIESKVTEELRNQIAEALVQDMPEPTPAAKDLLQ